MNRRTNMFSQGHLEGLHHRCRIISLLINEQLDVSLSLGSFFLALYDVRNTSMTCIRHECLYYPTYVYKIKMKRRKKRIFYNKI